MNQPPYDWERPTPEELEDMRHGFDLAEDEALDPDTGIFHPFVGVALMVITGALVLANIYVQVVVH